MAFQFQQNCKNNHLDPRECGCDDDGQRVEGARHSGGQARQAALHVHTASSLVAQLREAQAVRAGAPPYSSTRASSIGTTTLVDVLIVVTAASLKTLTVIIHLEKTNKLTEIIETRGRRPAITACCPLCVWIT